MSNTKNKNNIFYNDFKPDFLTLIKEFPELKKYILKQNEDNEEEFQFDWSNNELSLLMDKSILNYYFDIKYYDIPKGFLIPPIPSRINYINLINSIITKLIKDINIKNIIGIDIGTGANIIYPILGYSIYKWKFICTEINKEAYNNAKLILQKNNLENNINIIKQNNKDNIFISVLNRENKYIFSMCNPPYYNYENEIKLEDKKRDNEYNFDEIYYKNGEYGFFQRYFEESICYKNNVFLYTILIGKKINAENIYDKLSSYSDIIKIYNMQKILTGNNVRYIIYWSFFNNYKDFNNIKLYSNKYNKFRPIIKY
jgi:23S rRNA (adenine1618-N6)-methyltransferase